MPPNIIIFMSDQWRGDYVGAAGHPFIRTPNHDRFAEDGMVFTQAYTTHPICGPSRCSFCTGWYPHTRGHRSQETLIEAHEPHLFQYLKDAGYTNVWCGKNDMLSDEAIAQSVDIRLSPKRRPTTWGKNPYDEDDPRFYSFYYGPLEGSLEDHRDVQNVRAAQEFLNSNPSEPFCLWVNTTFPHPPYAAPEPYASMYDPDAMDDPIPGGEYAGMPAFMAALNKHSRMDRVNAEHIRKMRAMYCGMVSMADDLIGDLTETMHDAGLADSTAMFVTSDHGNFTGDYGLAEKWHTACQDAIARVPMAVRLPGGTGQHGTTDALVQHMDVFGTILDLCDIEPRWHHHARSMLPIMRGEAETVRDDVLACSGTKQPLEKPHLCGREKLMDTPKDGPYYSFVRTFAEQPEAASLTFMLRTSDWKYVWRQHDIEELYDLSADPQELHNLLHEAPERVPDQHNNMKTRLLARIAETCDVMPGVV